MRRAMMRSMSEQDDKNPAAVELGRLGGIKGGPARARKLSKARRIEIARKAGKASGLARRRRRAAR